MGKDELGRGLAVVLRSVPEELRITKKKHQFGRFIDQDSNGALPEYE
jgi:hypothetical protein